MNSWRMKERRKEIGGRVEREREIVVEVREIEDGWRKESIKWEESSKWPN